MAGSDERTVREKRVHQLNRNGIRLLSPNKTARETVEWVVGVAGDRLIWQSGTSRFRIKNMR